MVINEDTLELQFLQRELTSVEGQPSLDLVAVYSASFQGSEPNTYRALNQVVLQFVDTYMDTLEELAKPKVDQLMRYMGIEVEGDLEGFLWDDQVDYSPVIIEGRVVFKVDMLFDEIPPEDLYDTEEPAG